MSGKPLTIRIEDLANEVSKDPKAVRNWKNILRKLNIKYVSVSLEKRNNNGTVTDYELFLEIFEEWKSQKPKEANIETLKEILKEGGINDAIVNLDALLATKVLDGIHVEKLLGKGCFGFVFQINYGPVRGRRAHKLFQANWKEYTDTPELAEEKKHFHEREGKMLAADHPNLVKIYKIDIIRPWAQNFTMSADNVLQEYVDASIEKVSPFEGYSQVVAEKFKDHFPTIRIEMELCGPSLKEWLIDAMRLRAVVDTTFSKRIEIANGLIDGLTYLHEQMDIIHRDIKPDNIMFSKEKYEGDIKIGDFGISRPADGDDTKSMTGDRGSRLYRPPEIDTERYSKRADLYSFGLVLFVMFYFLEGDERARCFKDVETTINKLQEIKEVPKLKETIVGLTKKNTKERIQYVKDVCHF